MSSLCQFCHIVSCLCSSFVMLLLRIDFLYVFMNGMHVFFVCGFLFVFLEGGEYFHLKSFERSLTDTHSDSAAF